MADPTRRDALKVTAGAVLAAPLRAQGAPRFFTREEFRMVDELTEMIIPADGHSPGARAAQCAAYIDLRLAEAFEPETRQQWRDGLKRLDELCRRLCGQGFLEAAAEQRTAVLRHVSEREAHPESPEELFFKELKARTANAYYTSRIGIHAEMQYKGNVAQAEYAGYEAK